MYGLACVDRNLFSWKVCGFQHPTSWELANLAALYWRVEGNPVNAVNCLRLALANSPSNARVRAF